ncbi:hypothetical protein HYV70_02445 [Candidatus Uhrbacteria bacterium]|nr:hypothetical protein [Candidatus Uhrbacteria bacterium]
MARGTCEGRTKISIFWLRQKGYLTPDMPWRWDSLSWTNTYSGESAGSLSYQIKLDENKEPNSKVGYMRLMYTNTSAWSGEKTEIDYEIPIVTTGCNYGGIRFWFRCPLNANGVYCGRRIGVLYKISQYYGCRHCGDLVYAAQNEKKSSRDMVCCPDLDKAHDNIRRFHYNEKPTKKYRKYLKLEQKFNDQIQGWMIRMASDDKDFVL